MAGLDFISTQETIVSHIGTEFSAYEVIEDGLLDDEYLLKQSGIVKPYIVVRHGQPVRSAVNTSFAGVRHDEYSMSVMVSVVAPKGKQVRQALNLIYDTLAGYKPTGGSALTPYASGGPWAVYDDAGSPHVFTGSVMFTYNVDTEPDTFMLEN